MTTSTITLDLRITAANWTDAVDTMDAALRELEYTAAARESLSWSACESTATADMTVLFNPPTEEI